MATTTTQGTVRPLTGFNGFVTRENLSKIIRQQFVNNADGRRCMRISEETLRPVFGRFTLLRKTQPYKN